MRKVKKVIILIIILGLAGIAIVGGYSLEKDRLNNKNNASTTINTNKKVGNNNTTAESNNASNSNNNQSLNKASNSTTQSVSNSNSNNETDSKIANNQTENLNISPNFTQGQINTLNNLGEAQKINLLSGTMSPIINLDYYSVVNDEKYYMEYQNTIPGDTFTPNNSPKITTANTNGNYSGVQFEEYVNQYGQTISQSEFLNGNLSFNPSNPINLTNQDKVNMIKKIAAMYFNYGGYIPVLNSFTVSKKYLENGVGNNNISMSNMQVDLNNTINVNGQTLYELNVEQNEPFYISLTGLVYTNEESYLAKPFKLLRYTNAQVKQVEKGM